MQYEVGLYVSGILRVIVFYTFLVDCRCELLVDLCCLKLRQSSASFYTLFLLYYISSYADFCFFITVYCLTLCIAWY